MYPFKLKTPDTLDDVIFLLQRYKDKAKIIAGGTDLVVELKQDKVNPDYLISLQKVKGLNNITHNDREIRIGAMVTHSAIEKSEIIKEHYPLLIDAVSSIGSIQVRNVATIGGNICNGAPSADTAAPLLAMDAKLLIEGTEGERVVPISEFYVGPGETTLRPDELLKEFIIAIPTTTLCSKYIKYSRRKAMELPLLGVAVVIYINDDETCADAAIALSLSCPIPVRIEEAELHVKGKPLLLSIWQQAGCIAEHNSSCRTSFRTTSDYRENLIRVLIPRAAEEALSRVNINMLKG